MREKKFRGKRLKDNRFVYGSLVINDDNCRAFIIGSVYEDEDDIDFYYDEIDIKTAGCCIGISDMHHRDHIYEGDILSFSGIENRPVVFVRGAFGYNPFTTKFLGDEFISFAQIHNISEKIEVIGNIYENPELIGNRTK